MEDKIRMSVKCPKCGVLIQFEKRIEKEKIGFVCPGCSSKVMLTFDTSATPQTVKATLLESPKPQEPEESPKKDTSYKKDTVYGKEEPSSHRTQETPVDEERPPKAQQAKKDTVYGSKADSHKTPKVPPHYYDEDDEPEERPKPRPKRKLRDKIYLTHVRMLGLVKDKYRLEEGRTVVGREDYEMPSDIMLKGDNAISRQSIVITIEADDYGFDYKLFVKNATNDVKVNGHRVRVGEEVRLDFGDVIRLGSSKLIFDNK